MGQYRPSRNIEASIIEFIEDELQKASWTNVSVEKAFSHISPNALPAIWVHLSNTIHKKVQIGDNSTYRTALVLLEVYGTNDGIREDLKDFLVSIFKNGCPYYEYVITGGAISDQTQNGRIRVSNIDDKVINLGIDKSDLDIVDQFRHLITLTAELGKVEV